MESKDETGADMMRSRVERTMEDLRIASEDFINQLQNDGKYFKRSIWVALSEIFSQVISGVKNFFSYKEIQNVQENSKHLTVQFNELSKNQEIVIENQNYLSEKLEVIESKLHLSLYINEFVSRVKHNIEILKRFTQAMISLHSGLTPVSIFSNADADRVFDSLRDQAALQGKTLIIDDGIQLYGSKTSFFVANHTLEIWLHTQCYDKTKRFSLFEKLNLPLVRDGNSFMISDPFRFIATTEGLERAFMEADKKVVVLENLDNCQQFRDRSFLCPDLTFWKNFETICLANLFLFDSTKNCKIENVETRNRYTYTYNNLLVFSFPESSEIVEICDHKVKYSTLAGTFKYDLKPNCVLHTVDFYLRGKFDSHFNTNLTRKSLFISGKESTKFEPPIKESKFKEMTYNRTQIEFEVIDDHDIVQYVMSGFIVIIVVGIIGFLFIKSKRLVTQANNVA